jgi:hypothetical protein
MDCCSASSADPAAGCPEVEGTTLYRLGLEVLLAKFVSGEPVIE